MRAISFLLLVPLLGSCTPGISIGTGGAGGGASGSQTAVTSSSPSTSVTGSTSSTSSTSPTSSSTGGGPCVMGAVCTDQNPCTDDVCGTNGCVSTPKAAGQPGNASEGACVGVCQTDGACGLRLYSRTFPAAGNWTPNPPALSTVWTGPNAPPPRGILDAAHAYADSRLFVWADNGMFYQQSGGTWMPPVPTATAFPGLGATNLGCAEVWQPNAGGPLSVLLAATGTTPRQAFVYSISALGTITADGANPYTITPTADPEGAPQDTVDCDWSLQVQNAYVGSPGWVIFWRHYGDKVYEYDGSSDNWIANWLDVGSPLWAGSNPPAPNSVAGAYYNQLTAYLIAP